MEPNDSQDPQSWRFNHGLIPGAIVVGIGVLFLLGNLGYIHDWWRYWPVALIAVGLVKLVDAPSSGGRTVGGVMLVAGAILLADNIGLIAVTIDQLWPLILIAIGAAMLANRIWGPQWYGPHLSRHDRRHWDKRKWKEGWRSQWEAGWKQTPGEGVNSNEFTLNEVAIFGGGKRKVVSQDFKGGALTAIFGGFEVDLREAGMTGDSVTLEVNAVFGGAEIRIPYAWTAVVQGVGIFGGYGDETEPPRPSVTPQSKKLFLTGAAVFGGVSVKN